MCGFAGFLDTRRVMPAVEMEATVRKMAATLAHRGPDGAGVMVDEAAGIALGHQRLAVLDPSARGGQPMVSADGRLVIVYNGEVYNFRSLRQELVALGHVFVGDSDTEVVLAACLAWGVRGAVGRFSGMFAFALWNRRDHRLTLARDPFGIKPLYWGRFGASILFASQPKALFDHPHFTPAVDRQSLDRLLRFSYIAAPRSIYAGLHKLPANGLVEIEADGECRLTAGEWSVEKGMAAMALRPFPSVAAGEEAIMASLEASLRAHLVADVPVGAFLSGGVDSSLMVAVLSAHTRVKTFTAGFRESTHDESAAAQAVADHLGCEHTAFVLSPRDALAVIAELPEWFDEPFADPSQIPSLLLARLTRQQVTVALSGDGGDELFLGYDRYWQGQRLAALFRHLPEPLRQGMAGVLARLPVTGIWGERMKKSGRILSARDLSALYPTMRTFFPLDATLVPGVEPWPFHPLPPAGEDLPRWASRQDLLTYLPESVLTKADRAGMAVGLEVRVPFLSRALAESAWRLPLGMCRRWGTNKWMTRRLLRRFLPAALVDRPKMGFGVPVGEWLKGPLRSWAEDLLSEESLQKGDLLMVQPIRALWKSHLSGKRDHRHALWNVLMAVAWRQRWGGK